MGSEIIDEAALEHDGHSQLVRIAIEFAVAMLGGGYNYYVATSPDSSPWLNFAVGIITLVASIAFLVDLFNLFARLIRK